MIKNIEAMEWQNNDTLRTMVSKYNSNMRKLCTEYNQTAKATEDRTMISPNCSYAKVCDWKDGNKFEEERYGYFVTLTESSDIVTIADNDSEVLGVTTENPAFSSNADDDKFKLGKLSAAHCYVSILGTVMVRQDGSITEGVKFCCNFNGVAKATDSIGYKVTKIIDENYVLIDLEPSTELIGKIYEELSQKIDNKKAGLIEVSYETWLSLTQEERVILGDVIVPDHPDHPDMAELTQSILLSSETNEFIYDSDIITVSKTTLLHNVFNVDENLVLYKSNDHSKFNLSTITYKSAVEVDLRVEDIHGWRWYCILPIASEKTTFDITTATWKLSGYQPSHDDDEEEPTEPTIEKVDYATFLLENSSDASNEAIFDLYELEGVTRTIIKRELSAKVLDELAESISKKLDIQGASRVGMPSERHIELSPSVTSFTAIDDGYITVDGTSKSASHAFIYVTTSDNCKSKNSANGEEGMMLTLPVRKGTQVDIRSDNANVTKVTFIYAEGAK